MLNKEKKDLRVFGYGLSAIIVILVVRYSMKHEHIGAAAIIFLGLALVLSIMTSVNYLSIKPLYKVWMRVAHGIGNVVLTVFLTIFFYCVFGVIGIILRALRKDLLDERMDLTRASYWSERKKASFNRNDYQNQY